MRGLLLALLLTTTVFAAQSELKVRIADRVVSLPLERYVAAVLAGEDADERSDEALKAMAVAARTYAVDMRGRHAADGYDLCDSTHCQRVNPAAVTARLERAAADTAGEMLWYGGKPAFTAYTSDCGGTTEDGAAPYLKSHPDVWCLHGPDSRWHWSADANQIARVLKNAGLRAPNRLDRVSILNRTASGRASVLLLSGPGESVRMSASSFRFAIGRALGWNTLPSDAWNVNGGDGHFYFEGTGSGHGVGLCQRGAAQMGGAGHTYREILAYYYPGTTLGLNAAGLAWQHLSGEVISLATVQPDNDRIALSAAERLAKALSARTAWPVPAGIEIRVYPDLDAFRNATGEPGWVAARTDGRRIHLQPVALLRSRGLVDSTLSHELAHVMMEAQAAPGLPLWFREGIVDYLGNARTSGVARIPAEADLRQRSDPAAARRAYAEAEAMVASAVRTYGETTVLGWVKRGLPADVTKASISQTPTKSR